MASRCQLRRTLSSTRSDRRGAGALAPRLAPSRSGRRREPVETLFRLAPPAEGAPPVRDMLRQPTPLGRFEMPVVRRASEPHSRLCRPIEICARSRELRARQPGQQTPPRHRVAEAEARTRHRLGSQRPARVPPTIASAWGGWPVGSVLPLSNAARVLLSYFRRTMLLRHQHRRIQQ
jgi:hypothetical protein